jgi:alcohol dehydrogenase
MRAVVFDGELTVRTDYPIPDFGSGWARIRIRKAGICQTDLEIMKGYMGFKGVLGHEFVGVVEACDDSSWIGKRVVGDINAACGKCEWCSNGLERHCPSRTTLGIYGLDGCMADFCVLPVRNLIEIPGGMSNTRVVLTEPLAAACEILEQLQIDHSHEVVVLGDGRLGIMCSWVLITTGAKITLVGRHRHKLKIAEWRHLKCITRVDDIQNRVDIVVDATGSARGFDDAVRICKPRGTIVLKSTVASKETINLSPLVVNEITLLGSRCGQLSDALAIMRTYPDMPLERLISACYPLEEARSAFDRVLNKKSLKVMLGF